MSRAWIAFYMGDYLKKTQRLTTEQHGAYLLLLIECWQMGRVPTDQESQAAIARIPLPRWRKIGPAVSAYFNADGTNKRATEEIEKAEVISLRRSMAGTVGGKRSGMKRTIARGEAIKLQANHEAKSKQMVQQTPKQNGGNSEANHNREITTTSSLAARESEEGASLPARPLASALPTGALAPGPDGEQADGKRSFEGKKPNEMTKQELDDFYDAKRAREAEQRSKKVTLQPQQEPTP